MVLCPDPLALACQTVLIDLDVMVHSARFRALRRRDGVFQTVHDIVGTQQQPKAMAVGMLLVFFRAGCACCLISYGLAVVVELYRDSNTHMEHRLEDNECRLQ